MKILNVTQGSPAWQDIRWKIGRSASEAPAMMNDDPKMSRAELVRMKALGLEREFGEWVRKNLLDKGHEVEAQARPIAEEEIGDELYPVTATDDAGYLLASLDGQTMDEETLWEHKMWNDELADAVLRRELPPEKFWQLEHQLLVSGAKRVVFSVSNGTKAKYVSMEYLPVPGRAEALLAGWKQFDQDVANYSHVEVIPAAVAAPIKDLPALAVEIDGKVVASNLAEWRAAVTERIDAINTDLQTDNDFADADKMVKFLADGEKRIDLVKSQAQAQAASIDETFRALDEIKAAMRAKRLELDALVKTRKENIRGEIRDRAVAAFGAHVSALNKRLERVMLPAIAADFAGAMKGKKTVQSLNDAVDGELARAKIEANALADKIDANLKAFDAMTSEGTPNYGFLFPDFARLVLKEPDDLVNVIKARIAEHQAAEVRRVEAERERIRAEERRRADQEAEERRREDQRQQEAAKAQQKAADDAASAKTIAPIVAAEIAARSAAPQAPEPTHAGITGSAKLRDLIDDQLQRMTIPQLQEALDAIMQIRARKAA